MNDLSAKVARLKLIGELLANKKALAEAPADAKNERLRRVRRMLEIRKMLGESEAAPAPEPAPDPTPSAAAGVEQQDPAPTELFAHDPNRKPSQRKRDNAAAVELLNRVRSGELAGDALTTEQKAILSRYSGLGGNLVSEGERGSDYEYYTPRPIAQGAWDLLQSMGFSGGKVLDPCGGAGIFGATAPASAAVDAIELSETSGLINGLVNQRPGYQCTLTSSPA